VRMPSHPGMRPGGYGDDDLGPFSHGGRRDVFGPSGGMGGMYMGPEAFRAGIPPPGMAPRFDPYGPTVGHPPPGPGAMFPRPPVAPPLGGSMPGDPDNDMFPTMPSQPGGTHGARFPPTGPGGFI
jgi:hypothetical protein